MNEAMEALLQHWADCLRGGIHGANGYRSPLATAMEHGGVVIQSGRRGGAGMLATVDLAAEEVDAALAVIRQRGLEQDKKLAKAWREAGQTKPAPFCLETQLIKLAKVRYLSEPMPTVEQQMRRLKVASKRTYHDRVQQLHEMLQAELQRRRGLRAA